MTDELAVRHGRGSPIFGAKLRALRRERGLSLKKFGEALDAATGVQMRPVAICRIEAGMQALTPAETTALAKFFQLPLPYLFDEERMPRA